MVRLRWIAPLFCLAFSPVDVHSFGQNGATAPVTSPVTPGPPSECPWLTTGSAAHTLQRDVRVTVSLKDKAHGVCTFSTLDKARSELSVFVGGDELKSCPRDSPAIAAIGTYAYLCSFNPSTKDPQRMLSGAVREKHFAVVTRMEAGPSGGTSFGATDRDLKELSEMIAGNLF